MESEVLLLKQGDLCIFGLEEIKLDSELDDIIGGSCYTGGVPGGGCYCFSTAGGWWK